MTHPVITLIIKPSEFWPMFNAGRNLTNAVKLGLTFNFPEGVSIDDNRAFRDGLAAAQYANDAVLKRAGIPLDGQVRTYTLANLVFGGEDL